MKNPKVWATPVFAFCCIDVRPRPLECAGNPALWGDTHLHTSNSLDAFQTGNFNADPDTAFRFAKGLPVLHSSLKVKVHILRPLDFLVVSDHAEQMALQSETLKGNPLAAGNNMGKEPAGCAEAESRDGHAGHVSRRSSADDDQDMETTAIRQGIWGKQVDAAERNNEPGKFTAFVGWEWTVHPGGKNLHRVVFTTANAATAKKFLPFTANDSQKPEDYGPFSKERNARPARSSSPSPTTPISPADSCSIWSTARAAPMTAEYARMRIRWEPVMEATQAKGTSEVHPELSPNDEFAEFEIRRKLLAGAPTPSNKADYARSACCAAWKSNRVSASILTSSE